MGFLYFSNFNIRIAEKTGREDFFSTSGKEVLRIMSDTRFLSKDPVCVCADPFLFEHKGELFLFYEYQKKRYGLGELHMRKTSDLKEWSSDKLVLKENFHLSFPNVFEDNGNIYMLPETGADGSIRLYKATDDSLEHWELSNTIIRDGRMWSDSDIVRKDGHYYLYSSIHSRKKPEPHIFVSDSPEGEFRELSYSPLESDPAKARNAGRFFSYDGKLFRPAQDCSKGYGKQLSILEIKKMDENGYYEEMSHAHILDKTDKFFRRGGHQFCPVNFNGKWIIATDAKQRNYNLRENLAGIRRHLFK